MQKKFDHKEIEEKWQQKWSDTEIYKTDDTSDKKKAYILDMFPYPSGEGLHVGHPKGYIATDIYARYKRMNNYEVLHPMGWDAFGLPAENYAIKNKVHPRVAVGGNIARFKEQLSLLGLDYDWNREINTTDPSYYKWTQWIFIQLFKKGLAYESHEPINWCPSCQTGLANEDLDDGRCERCDSEVEKRPMRQWVLKIREYADRLLEDLDTLTWPEHIKEAQRNWIGRSEGAEIDFTLAGFNEVITVFTTRPDTLAGATYMVLAPEHALIEKNALSIRNIDAVREYVKTAANKSEIERTDLNKDKTGIILEGVEAVNPLTKENIPVYVADYVLGDYGTGAIMAVPAHDERDNEFAKKFDLPIKQVVRRVFGTPLPNSVPRIAVGAVVYDSKTDKYLVQYSHEFNKYSFIFGGLEDGESYAEAAVRETLEETGYKTEFVRYITEETESSFYHPGKNINRALVSRRVLLKLVDDNQIEISEEELRKQKPVWLTKVELIKELSAPEEAYAVEALFTSHIYTGVGKLCSSGEFDGMSSEEAKEKIIKKVGGRKKVSYKIRDWVFSRQRYWGEPIPIIHCEKCGAVPVPEEQLPVLLPDVESYAPTGTGESPLAGIDEWVNATCPRCDGKAKRETNTMPQWAGSSWYYLRFMDPDNDSQLVSKAREERWAPVDVYVGGAEHATRHLIYARFWHKFLHDIDVVGTEEPFKELHSVGLIQAEDGRKMSKRWGNVINPNDVVAQVGADTLRIYEMFMGPFENTIAWSTNGLVGARRFIERVWRMADYVTEENVDILDPSLHKTIEKVQSDIEQFKFNTAISQMMIFVNEVEEVKSIGKSQYLTFLRVLAPFAPHVAEELWEENGEVYSVHRAPWPEVDTSLLKEEIVEIAIQINGKVRGTLVVSPDAEKDMVIEEAKREGRISELLSGVEIVRSVYVPGRIVNFVVTSPDKKT